MPVLLPNQLDEALKNVKI